MFQLKTAAVGLFLVLGSLEISRAADNGQIPSKELVQYIHEARRRGVAETKIKKQALAVGWPEASIDEAIAYEKSGKPLPSRPAPEAATLTQAQDLAPAAEPVQVSAGGSTAVPFTVQATTASGGSWLSVTPLNAVTPASLSLSFSISGLQPGVYTGTVTLTSGSATQVTIAVSLTVVAATNVVLNAVPRRSRSRSSPEERFRRRNPWPSPYQGRPSSFRPM